MHTFHRVKVTTFFVAKQIFHCNGTYSSVRSKLTDNLRLAMKVGGNVISNIQQTHPLSAKSGQCLCLFLPNTANVMPWCDIPIVVGSVGSGVAEGIVVTSDPG